MGHLRAPSLLPALAVAALAALAQPSHAACYEDFGCTDSDRFAARTLRKASCDVLWDIRNGIYKENGYCFRTARAISEFGNAGCAYDDAADVPLNAIERQNIAAVQSVENAKGCE